ncbi:MAG: cyclic nucleotide-binding domain-containing protein [Acidobacteriota bacterium]|nr:cyclic nucleotide-binding domain-containing protein [Acidobacteriota bacterium]
MESRQPAKERVVLTPEMLKRLHAVGTLRSLNDQQMQCLSEADHICMPADTLLWQQGETSEHFWILLAGDLKVVQTRPDGHETVLAHVHAGSTFGELPLLAKIPAPASMRSVTACELLQLNEDQFWGLMTSCPEVRRSILGNMAVRLQRMQSVTTQQEKMASLGTLAAGLMHELNNPGTAAKRAASQLRENLLRMHQLTERFTRMHLTPEQKQCMFDLQKDALHVDGSLVMSSLEQSDAEERLAEWMESQTVEDAWRLAPTLVSIGMTPERLECTRYQFPGEMLSLALNWLEALVSSMQLVGTIEDSIGRVSDLARAVKSYAYEGKGQLQTIQVNDSIHATLVMLAHKLREKQVVLEKAFGVDLPPLHSACSGANQIWTNLLDNAIDAIPVGGTIQVKTWLEASSAGVPEICVSIADNGSGIPLENQQHIFDPFYTTKPVGVGTGLGLGIVQRIVEQFQGSISFTSNDQGTDFVVRLPVETSEPGCTLSA